jgi:hypothetical protein
MTSQQKDADGYEAPALKVLGPVAALTQACSGKRFGGSDTFIFRGQLVCTSGSG